MREPRRRLDDAALARHLRRRASGARLPPERRESLIQAAVSLRPADPRRRTWAPLVVPLAASIAVAAIVLGGMIDWKEPPPAARSSPRAADASTGAPTPRVAEPDITSGGVQVFTSQELAEQLAVRRPGLVGRTLIVSGEVTRDIGSCPVPPVVFCRYGRLGPEGVVLSVAREEQPWVADAAGQDLWAVRIHADAVQLLGAVAPAPGAIDAEGRPLPGTVYWAPRTVTVGTRPPGTLIAVKGWLVGSGDGSSHCPARPYGPRDETALELCRLQSWITDERVQPLRRTHGGPTIDPPEAGITVQATAYEEFAPHPGVEPGGAHVPREGIYLLRLTDLGPPCAVGECPGWVAIARLAATPDPSTVEQLSPLRLRAEAAVPDSNVPRERALFLGFTALKWLEMQHLSYAGDPLALATVDVAEDVARVTFHDFAWGPSIEAVLSLRDGEPIALTNVESPPDDPGGLTEWERNEAIRIATEDAVAARLESEPVRVPCPAGGVCARVSLEVSLEGETDHRDVTVDVGRAQRVVVAEPEPWATGHVHCPRGCPRRPDAPTPAAQPSHLLPGPTTR